jgi:hypothetical protein
MVNREEDGENAKEIGMAEGSGSRCAAVDLAPLPWKSWGECLGGSHQVHGTCLIEDDCSVTLSKTARGKRDDARLVSIRTNLSHHP